MKIQRLARLVGQTALMGGGLLVFVAMLDHSSPGQLDASTRLHVARSAANARLLDPGDDPQVQLFLPYVTRSPRRIVIAGAYVDSPRAGEPDEAVLLWNTGDEPQALAGWELDASGQQALFPANSTLLLEPGERLWCTAEATAFAQTFGELPACEWAIDTQPDVENLSGILSLPNAGGALALRDEQGKLVDAFVYGDESAPFDGWSGKPAQLYTGSIISRQGQVWQRKRNASTGLPTDSNTASDWAGDRADLAWGRQVRLPGWRGWDAQGLARPATAEVSATVSVAIGPEGLYRPIFDALQRATTSIDLSLYTLEHPDLALLLGDIARRGVQVRILLDGAPSTGISPLQKWCLNKIAAGGADIRYLAVQDDAPAGYQRRYRSVHAKYAIIDGRQAFVGTDNFSLESMPVPTGSPLDGSRGIYLFTDAPPVIQALQRIFAIDWDPEHFMDLRPYAPADALYGGPPENSAPRAPAYDAAANVAADAAADALAKSPATPGPFSEVIAATGPGRFMVMSAPENALRPDDGLQALIARAGPGDEIVAMQLYEHRNWGEATSDPSADPNPRLEALINAARRGARVLLLLDRYFDSPEELRSNFATLEYVRAVAKDEHLALDARRGNPAHEGIHAKMVLLRLGGETWSAVGSLNGGEVSFKLNREVVLLVDYSRIYGYLRAVFEHDWGTAE